MLEFLGEGYMPKYVHLNASLTS